MILSENQTILDVNDTTLKLLGKKRNEVLGEKCYRIFHNSDEPPPDCPFLIMKNNNWKISMNEMETIIGDFLITVVPMDIPGEERKVLHFARDVTLINQLGLKLIDSLQRYQNLLSILLRVDELLIKERNLNKMLKEVARIICEWKEFQAAWILLAQGKRMVTVAQCGNACKFEDKFGENVEDYKIENINSFECQGEKYLLIPLRVEENFIGAIILKLNSLVPKDKDLEIFKILGDNLAIAIRERRLEIGRSVAYRELEKNIENFAMLVDGIRNPLAVIMGIVEIKIMDYEVRNKIIREIEKIEEITNIIDERWRKSEYLRKFLKEM